MNIHILWLSDHKANNVEAHTHDFYQIIFCTKKGGQVSINEKSYNARENYAYFIKPGDVHSINRGNDMHIIEIKFLVRGWEEPADVCWEKP